MIRLTSDFECGNAKLIRQLDDHRFRLEVDGDKPDGYCVYFCFEVGNDGPEAEATVEIWEDSQFGRPTAFPVFFPTAVWVRPASLGRYRPLQEHLRRWCGDRVVLTLPVPAGDTLRVALTYVAPYSEVTGLLREFAETRPDRCAPFVLGESVEGRELAGLRCGTPGRPKVICLAGQHPHEHPGLWAVAGIADFLSSALPEAAELREVLDVWLVPTVNPDGNVHGRNASNAEGLDPYPAFGEDPDAPEPQSHESRLLWRWAEAEQPDLWINFHAYTGWRLNSEYPYEGWYEVGDRGLFRDPARRRLYDALCDTVRLETEGPSTDVTAARHPESSLCYQLAKRHQVPHVFYELNTGTSGRHRATRRGIDVFRHSARTLLHYIGCSGSV